MSFGPVGFPPQSNLIGAKVEIIDMTGGNGTSPSLPKKLNDDDKSSELNLQFRTKKSNVHVCIVWKCGTVSFPKDLFFEINPLVTFLVNCCFHEIFAKKVWVERISVISTPTCVVHPVWKIGEIENETFASWSRDLRNVAVLLNLFANFLLKWLQCATVWKLGNYTLTIFLRQKLREINYFIWW